MTAQIFSNLHIVGGHRPPLQCKARLLLTLLLIAAPAIGQNYTQRGFIEAGGTFYPQRTVNDRARAVGESLFRYEGFYTPSAAFQIAGAVDFRTDTHHQ